MLLYAINFAKNTVLNGISLNIIEDYVFYIIISIAILLSYLVVKPFVNWFIILQSVQLLSYLMSSLIIMILLLLIMFQFDGMDQSIINILKVGFHCLAIFGVLLLLYRLYQRVIKKSEKAHR